MKSSVLGMKDLLRSKEWQDISEQISIMINNALIRMETCELEDVPSIRGEIRGLRLALEVPETLIQMEESNAKTKERS